MQENTNILEKLNNHSLPINESYWAEMEGRLQNNRKKLIPLWAWFAGIGVAASLALLFIVQIFNADNEIDGTQISTIERTQITQIFADKSICTNGTQITQISTDNTFYKNPRKSASSAFRKVEEIGEVEEIEGNDIIINNNTQTKQYKTPEKQYELKPKYDDRLIAQNKPQKKNSWQIAAAFSSNVSNASNNNLTFSNGNMDYSSGGMYNRPSTEMAKSDPAFEDVFQKFPEITHLPPLSFGVTVRKNFNKHIAIETGLTYSFLQSKFKDDNEWQPRDATLKLHYLGVPVNAVAYLLNKPKWNIYFSLGGMVEKGLMLDYVQHNHLNYQQNSPVHTVSLQDNISGLQWSLNTSFGVDYKFYRNIGIYFEPRIMYYFKNNQPVSARTETPLLVGLNAGLRFEF